MPRLSELRLGALDDLASQLRYAPRARLVEQLLATTALARQIEPDRLYPEDWLVQRITGYRPELDHPVMIVGEALLRDLSAFTERVSDQARLDAGSLPIPTLSLAELRRRWSVSARTIERRRRLGLIALRVRGADGRARLAFPVESVEMFEQAHRESIEKAGSASRLDSSSRDRVARLAERSQRRFGWSLNEAARRIAAKQGRAHETIRRILFQRGGVRTSLGRGDRAPQEMHRAWRSGATVDQLAAQFGKSPASIRRIIDQRRCEILGSVGVIVPDRAAFLATDASAKLLGARAARERLREPTAATAGEFLSAARSSPPPLRTDEQEMARALRFLLWRARRAVDSPTSARPSTGAIDAAETDLRWALLLLARLVRSQRGLVVKTIESRLVRPMLELPAALVRSLHASVMDAAVAAAWGFDPFTGGRLASPVGLEVDRAVARWISANAGQLPQASGRARAPGVALEDWTTRLAPWARFIEPDRRLIDRLEGEEGIEGLEVIPPLARSVVELRYGLAGEPPETVESVSARLGLPARRLSQLEREALASVERSV